MASGVRSVMSSSNAVDLRCWLAVQCFFGGFFWVRVSASKRRRLSFCEVRVWQKILFLLSRFLPVFDRGVIVYWRLWFGTEGGIGKRQA